MAKRSDTSRKGGPGVFKLILIVVVLLLIPTTMEQLSMHPETVQLVGRICVGLAALFFLYGLIAKAMRIGALILLVLIAARALANEGVIEVPELRAWLEQQRDR